ncbi:MAG: hypothetical protein EOO22_14420 [Comamonadaceae bacterium]|nr:MAG: hypothetical protein EOO22_14420 [Comamonadaceae bacterium]
MKASGRRLAMPPIGGEAAHPLIDYFWEVGPTESTGMGPAPLTFQELHAWQMQMGLDLPPWQVRQLQLMSRAFLSESIRAEKPDCPAPWAAPALDRPAVAKHIRNLLRS